MNEEEMARIDQYLREQDMSRILPSMVETDRHVSEAEWREELLAAAEENGKRLASIDKHLSELVSLMRSAATPASKPDIRP